jgi:hypothetical protein
MGLLLASDLIIDRIVTALAPDGCFTPYLRGDELPFDLRTDDGKRAFGEAMFRLSVNAITRSCQAGVRLQFSPYIWKPERAASRQAFESSAFLFGQCIDGPTDQLLEVLVQITGPIACGMLLPERNHRWPSQYIRTQVTICINLSESVS